MKRPKMINTPMERIVMQSAERISFLLNLVLQGCWRDFRKEIGRDVSVLSVKEQNKDIKEFFELQIKLASLISSSYDLDTFFVYSFVKEYRIVSGENKCFEDILAENSELRIKFFKLKTRYQQLLREEMDNPNSETLNKYATVYDMVSEQRQIATYKTCEKKQLSKVI